MSLMSEFRLLVVTAAILSVGALAKDGAQVDGAQVPPPGGGRLVRHPTEKLTIFRLVSSKDIAGITNSVQIGLYRTEDGGTSWDCICRTLDFVGPLYVHPKTGVLYAAIYDAWLTVNDQGFLVRNDGFRVVMSKDGKLWRDITGDLKHLMFVTAFFQDPERPSKVCVVASTGLRLNVLQSIDDDYTSWITHPGDWPLQTPYEQVTN